MVRALREVEDMTDGTIVDIAALERADDSDGVPYQWVLTVMLLPDAADHPEEYRVAVAGDGSLYDYDMRSDDSPAETVS